MPPGSGRQPRPVRDWCGLTDAAASWYRSCRGRATAANPVDWKSSCEVCALILFSDVFQMPMFNCAGRASPQPRL